METTVRGIADREVCQTIARFLLHEKGNSQEVWTTANLEDEDWPGHKSAVWGTVRIDLSNAEIDANLSGNLKLLNKMAFGDSTIAPDVSTMNDLTEWDMRKPIDHVALERSLAKTKRPAEIRRRRKESLRVQ